jgi:hypothetical protein
MIMRIRVPFIISRGFKSHGQFFQRAYERMIERTEKHFGKEFTIEMREELDLYKKGFIK